MENNENNVQNQGKKQSKGISASLVIIMLIAVLIIGIGGGYLLSKNDSLFSKNETKSNNNSSNTTQSNNSTEQIKVSKKIDESKPWVYDANYGEGKEEKKITPQYSNDVYSTREKLKVPYININSEYAKNLNSEIKKIYDNAYYEFGTETVNQGGNIVTNIREIKYETYNKNNILSIVFTINSGVLNAGITHEYKTYNIDLDTLNKASLLDVGKAAGFQSQDELNKAIDASLLNAQKSQIASENAVRKDDLYYMDNTGMLNMMVLSVSEMGLTNIKITKSSNNIVENTLSNQEEYAKYYNEKIKTLDYVNNSTKYGLLDIAGNDIPYLVVDTGGDLSIYKINNNMVVALKEQDSYGTHGRDGYDYIEGTKIMIDYCTFKEGYAYEIYDEQFDYKYTVECTFNGEYRYSDNSGEKKIITEEEFNKFSYKNSTSKHLRNVANKNKEEMIKFLEN